MAAEDVLDIDMLLKSPLLSCPYLKVVEPPSRS
jgi:hypothetical protein